MQSLRVTLCLSLVILVTPRLSAEEPRAEYRPLFDGQTLAGWESPDMSYWSVEDGAITGRISKEHPCTVNQYLVWAGGDMAYFELLLESRLNGDGGINNGFQFRSRLLPDHDITGYQMDNNLQTPWLVRLYEEFGRHTLAMRGERTAFTVNGDRATGRLDGVETNAWFRLEDWHEYRLRCVGPSLTLWVNGKLAAETIDEDRRRQAFQGVLGLQLHSGPPTVVQFRNIRLKVLKPALPAPVAAVPSARRAALIREAQAWWLLDSGGHGAQPPLRHIPGWEKFQLNIRADGPGAWPGTRVVVLDGAYFDAGTKLGPAGEQATVYLRARDPRGNWAGGLVTKQGGSDRICLNLSGGVLPDTTGPSIGLKIVTEAGPAALSFPVSKIAATAWHDLVGRYDGRTLALFCDGRLMARQPWHGKLANDVEPLLIGAESEAGKVGRHFHGELQEAALWSRALTDRELKSLGEVR